MQTILTPVDAATAECRLASIDAEMKEGWRTHVVCLARKDAPAPSKSGSTSIDLREVKQRCATSVSADRLLRDVETSGTGIRSLVSRRRNAALRRTRGSRARRHARATRANRLRSSIPRCSTRVSTPTPRSSSRVSISIRRRTAGRVAICRSTSSASTAVGPALAKCGSIRSAGLSREGADKAIHVGHLDLRKRRRPYRSDPGAVAEVHTARDVRGQSRIRESRLALPDEMDRSSAAFAAPGNPRRRDPQAGSSLPTEAASAPGWLISFASAAMRAASSLPMSPRARPAIGPGETAPTCRRLAGNWPPRPQPVRSAACAASSISGLWTCRQAA